MRKKHFIALADKIRDYKDKFSKEAIDVLIDFCREQNSNFKAERWVNYIEGKCGKNGGKIKA